MPTRDSLALLKPAAALLIVLALGVAGFAVLHLEDLTELPDAYRLDLSAQLEIDPGLIHYAQMAQLPVDANEVHALAVGPNDHIYVAAEDCVQIFRPDGQHDTMIPLGARPSCLAVGGPDHVVPGRVYVGAEGRIELFDASGAPAGTWQPLPRGAVVTSIALADEDIFVADAASRLVWRLDPEGQVLGRIGDPRDGKGSRGFIIPSPYFDVVASPNGLVHVVNPGARRVETYAFDGKLETVWGQAGSDVTRFFGCCNPSHLATLPDGRFVTSEKGIPRVKVYGSEGDFVGVVAGPEQLAIRQTAVADPRAEQSQGGYDIATDSQGRVLVLDPTIKSIRVFKSKDEETSQTD